MKTSRGSFGFISVIIFLFVFGLMTISPTARAAVDQLPQYPSWSAEGDQANAYLGWTVASAGDVNKDGYADVLASAINYDNSQVDEGKVYLYYGGSKGLAGAPGWTAESNSDYALLGTSMANAGDVNGDGYTDVIIGASGYDHNVHGGAAFLYQGSPIGLSSSPDWSAFEANMDARFGAAVASAGDVNGDGYADVIVGAPNFGVDVGGGKYVQRGKAYVYYGSAKGLYPTPDWEVTGDQDLALFGYAVTACDLNHDGYTDVAVSAIDFDNGQQNEGRVFIYFGTSYGLLTTSYWTVEPDVPEADFGASLSCGDVTGDGRPDLLVGAQTYAKTQKDEGAVFVYFGVGPDDPFPGGTQVLLGNLENARLGASLDASGDLNGDGYKDAVVGAPNYTIPGVIEEGGVFVYLGSPTGLDAAPAWTGEVKQDYGHFGSSVAWAGDVDLDGSSDVISGAPYYDGNKLTDSGAIFAYYGPPPDTADLELQLSAASSVRSSQKAIYTLKTTNHGPQTASKLVVSDVLPVTLRFVSASGAGWTCSHTSGVVTCQRPSLAPGSAPDITLITLAAAPSGAILNTATVSGDPLDPIKGNNTASVSIQVQPLTLQLVRHNPAAAESYTAQPFTVNLEAASLLTVTVKYATADGTAKSNKDYLGASDMLTFAPGVTSRSFQVTLINDIISEPPTETFTVNLSNPVNAVLSPQKSVRFTIYDDDAPPVVLFSELGYHVVEADTTLNVTIRLSVPSENEVRVRCRTHSTGSNPMDAKENVNYIPVDSVLVFPPGATQAACPVKILDDLIVSVSKSFKIELSDPQNATLAGRDVDRQTYAYIIDNTLPTIKFDSPSYIVNERGGQVNVGLVANAVLQRNAVITYRTVSGTATAGADYVSKYRQMTLSQSMQHYTLGIDILDDPNHEPDETFFVEVTAVLGVQVDMSMVPGGPSPYHPPMMRTTVVIKDNDPAPEAYDLVSGPLEVTQGVQDLNNSVRLVQGRPTFVRYYPHTAGVQGVETTALLQVHFYDTQSSQWRTETLPPMNSGGLLTLNTGFDRTDLQKSFWFAIPSDWTRGGSVDLTATVDPDQSVWEPDYTNNTTTGSFSFESVPTLHVAWYQVGYCTAIWPKCDANAPLFDDNTYNDLWNNTFLILPLDTLETVRRSTVLPRIMGKPDYYKVLAELDRIKTENYTQGNDGDRDTPLKMHYYGVFNEPRDSGYSGMGNLPGPAAAGRSSDGIDSSTPPHELGHNFNRSHVNCNGSEAGPDPHYPYSGGRISPTFTLTDTNALFGFNILNHNVLPPDTGDLMGYCHPQWPGKYTYEAILNQFERPRYEFNPPGTALAAAAQDEGQPDNPGSQPARWYVSGRVASTGAVLDPLFSLPAASGVVTPTQGAYALVVKDVLGAELARHTFTPMRLSDTSTLFVSELVPQTPLAKRLELHGPTGATLASIEAGMAPPTVAITAPTFPGGAQVLVSPTVTVTWSASDPDGDPLTYQVFFSPDDGKTWELMADGLQETSVSLPLADLRQAAPGRFAVQASDGIHSASAQSDAFLIPNHAPDVQIQSPAYGTIIAVSQTLELQGVAYDPDLGDLPREKVQWSSDRDGLLGNGAHLSVTGLSVGVHKITLTANDGSGGVNWVTVQVIVVAQPDLVPPPDDALVASPGALTFDLPSLPRLQTFWIDNVNPTTPLTWTAQVDQPWLRLSLTSGVTPVKVSASLNYASLPLGFQTAQITLTSPALPGQEVKLTVSARGLANKVYLPRLRR
jgi:uncharacterized repeat protein (TIGR01451 family)